VAAPAVQAILAWSGEEWRELRPRSVSPSTPTAWALNTVVLDPVRTSKVRLLFTHALPQVAGVTEMRVWSR
jgi:hypothetical protein